MTIKRAWLGLLALPALLLGVLAGPAHASTLTCTNVAHATVAPFGCGGAELKYVAKGLQGLSVADPSPFTNDHVVTAIEASDPAQDFSVFPVDGQVTGGPGNLGRYEVMFTPDGQFSFTVGNSQKTPGNCGVMTPVTGGPFIFTDTQPCPGENFQVTADDFCLSFQAFNNGPRGAIRDRVLLRNCPSTWGEFTTTWTYGDGTFAGFVGNPNPFQIWAPLKGPGHTLFFENTFLSHNLSNTPFVLDDPGFGGPASWLLAFQINSGLNQLWGLFACTPPGSGFGVYANCP